MSGERGVHPDCRNASNPYHECVDYCFKQIAETKARLSQNKANTDGKTGPCHLNDDLANIPSSSGFDAKAKKKMVNEMLKCAPDAYEKSLKGFGEAHITPALVNLAEAMIRLGDISQWAASTQKEVKEVVGLATEGMRFEQRQSKELTDLKCSYAQLVATNKALNLRCEEHEAARKTAEAAQSAAAKALKLSEETLQSLQTSISKAVDEVVQPLNAHIANLQNQLSVKQDDVTKQLMDAFKDGESSSHGHWLEAYKWACGDDASTSPAVMEKYVEWLKEKESREFLGRSPISEFIDDITDDKEEREDEDVVDVEN